MGALLCSPYTSRGHRWLWSLSLSSTPFWWCHHLYHCRHRSLSCGTDCSLLLSHCVCEDKEPVLKQLIGPVFQVWAWILSFRVVSGHPVSSWLALTPLPGDTKCVHTRGREDSTQVTMESREVILSVVVVLLKTVSHIAQVDWKSRSLTLYILCLK